MSTNTSEKTKAILQGQHHLERAVYFYKTALRLSKQTKTRLNWNLKIIPGAGHNNRKMSLAAALILESDIKHATQRN